MRLPTLVLSGLLLSACATPWLGHGFRAWDGKQYVNVLHPWAQSENLREDLELCTHDGQTNEQAAECMNEKGWRVSR